MHGSRFPSSALSGSRRLPLAALALALAAAVAGCGDDDGGDPPLSACGVAAAEAAAACVADANAAWQACFSPGAEGCGVGGPDLAAALATLRADVTAACGDGDFLGLSADAVAGRLGNACASEAASLAWRSFGGPQASVFANAAQPDRDCLRAAHVAGAALVEGTLDAARDCLAPGGCDAGAFEAARDALAATARGEVAGECAGAALEELAAVSADVFVARAAHQADCLTATSFPATGPLALTCGPSNVDFDGVRGEWVRVEVDGEKWGTRCGDGSPYAFHVRLAPEGARLDRVLVGLQGGGVCAFEEDCAARLESSPGLFTAMDDTPPETGIASLDLAESPFADWTHVYLPYCNQDVFAGGGVDEVLGEITVPRYGSVNLRAAVQMVRDVIWQRMDAEGGDGFRPDEIVALFGGWSAGGYGTLYNYHWFLDDLQWPRTAAFPDAGLALDNGEILGVSGLGLLKIPVWGAQKNLPPYCFAGDCALGPVLYRAISPRLLAVPEQQFLIVSNPRDRTQQRDAFFGGEDREAEWINAIRQSYCDTKDLPGIQYYLTSVSDESVHVVSLRPELWTGSVDGVVMRDWFERAATMPDTIEDRAEEANFAEAIPGVEPFPCAP